MCLACAFGEHRAGPPGAGCGENNRGAESANYGKGIKLMIKETQDG